MALTDREIITQADLGLHGNAGLATAETSVNQLHQRLEAFYKIAADALAATATDLGFNFGDRKVRIKTVKFVPHAALTSNDTDYATLNFAFNDGAGGANTLVAAMTTKTSGSGGSGNWTANVPVSLTVTATNADVAASKLHKLVISKTGAGVVVPAGVLQVVYQEI